ncbi:MAG: DUF2442 domain-containing protein [Burkholderiales bacterium]
MQSNETPETHRAPEVTPRIRHAVPWRVTSVTALADARLRVTFVDGTTGEVNMAGFLSSAKINGSVFEPLRDPEIFMQASVELGAVQWPSGADLAPDAMYDEIKSHGHWVLE